AEVISSYLPEQLSEDDIRKVVKGLIEKLGASSMKDMGKVMGAASKELAGKADNKLVSDIVKDSLS
ncbi:MAG: GatB/YqeY domain-containing protein, partial [Actinobacteria bacterium]|nr:GatB/YqeY domain-containing protein [Actinomycetota bacterium]